MLFRRTATLALSIAFGFSGVALAEIVEGTVSKITAQGRLQIVMPEGTRVSEGDGVEVLADIPGLGPIASKWKVMSATGGTVTAAPLGIPSGTPQVRYTARIDTEGGGPTAQDPLPAPIDSMAGRNFKEGHSVSASEEAESLYQAARELSQSSSASDLIYTASLYRLAAEMTHPLAMTELGARLSFGRGVERDDDEALDWQIRAAERGSADAFFRLGLIHGSGRGVPTDKNVAAEWIKKAAAQGHANAMFMLAMLYEDGIGVPASMVDVVQWLEAAADQGNSTAMFFLGHIYLDGEDGVILEDNLKAEKNWLAAAKAGHGGAMQALSQFYEGRSDEDAEKWAEAARSADPSEDGMSNVLCLSDWECYVSQ